jgi:hypothetical protein
LTPQFSTMLRLVFGEKANARNNSPMRA